MTPARGYLVQHHHAGAVRHLGDLADGAAHHATLDPFVSRPRREGLVGTVALVDAASGETMARWRLRPFGGGPRDHSVPGG